MTRKNSNRRWINNHIQDFYVLEAKRLGYRSRAAFKLLEFDDRFQFLRKARIIVDLGAAPGGWSQVCMKRVSCKTRVLAVDLLEMPPLPGVEFLQLDFSQEQGEQRMQECLSGEKVDVVLSDILPNVSGVRSVDQSKSLHLCDLSLEFARENLSRQGVFVVKVLQGEGFLEFRQELGKVFQRVILVKPKASRSTSKEVYFYGQGLFP